MTTYYKTVRDGYITLISTGAGQTEIPQNEYDQIMQTINERPQNEDGYGYRLREDLTWERYELPPEEETLDNG